MKQWGLAPKFKSSAAAHPSVSEYLISRIAHNTVIVKPDIAHIENDAVVFTDGSKVPADIIYLATGYNISLPFLDIPLIDEEKNSISLYKRIFAPKYPNLVFVGLIQPYGAFLSMIELQARLVGRVFKGAISLPSEEAMMEEITEFHEELRKTMNPSRRHTLEVDHSKYLDYLSTVLGVKPNIWRRPKLIIPLLFDVLHPAQFRLDGPGSWDGAEEYLLKLHKRLHHK